MSAIRWRKGVRPRGLCHPPACWPARRPYPWGGSHLRLACPPRLPSFACHPRPARVLPMRRSRTVYALLARCPRFAPRTTRCAQLRPPAPPAPPAPWNMPSRTVRTFAHSRVRIAHTISIRRLAWGRTRGKGGNRDARAFRLPLSREGELYTAVRRFGLEVFQLPPSREGEQLRSPTTIKRGGFNSHPRKNAPHISAGSAQSADKAHKRKNRSDQIEIRGDFCFRRQQTCILRSLTFM